MVMGIGEMFGKLGFGSGNSGNASVELKIPDGMQLVPINPQQTPGSQQNTTIPGSQAKSDGKGPAAFPAAGEGAQSPLENYADLFILDDKQKAAAAASNTSLVPELKFDQKAVLERLSKTDFTKNLSEKARDAAKQGDVSLALSEILPAAMTGVMGYANTLLSNSLKVLEDKFNNEVLPSKLKEFQIDRQVIQDNPVFENPVVSPVMEVYKDALRMKFPDASPAEISAKAKEVMLGVSTEIAKSQGYNITKSQAAATTKSRNRETDFSTWLNS